METLEELEAQHPDLVAQLREKWEAEKAPEPVAEATPEPEPNPEPDPVAEVEAPKAEVGADQAIAELREEVARLKSGRMLDEALAREPVDQSIKDAAHETLREEVFTDEPAFRARFDATLKGLKEVASKAAGARVADLGGAPPPEPVKFTLGDLTSKKEAK